MKQFFKFFTASCLGVFAALALIFLVGMIVVSSMSKTDTTVKKNSILKLDLARVIPEKSDNVKVSPLNLEASEAIGLRSLRRMLDMAANDDKIEGILLTSQSVSLGQANILSMIDALKKFKESGKWVYAYADYYSQGAYFLNSVADSIFLNPNGMVDVKGYGSIQPFFKNGMDKLGVKMNIFYAGDFKSATEPFRREDMSANNKLQVREFLNGMLDVFVDQVTEARGFSRADLDNIMNEYKGGNAKTALESNLVDELIYFDNLEDRLREKLGMKDEKKISYIDIEEYKLKKPLVEKGPFDSRVAVVYAEGTVGYGNDDLGAITDKKYMKIFDDIRRNDKIKAVVLRVNSGGGSALTSDIIWDEIAHLKSDGIPVVSSFGDVAASGGYYIAANSDTIVAMPNTLTGSIGVFMMFPNFTELSNDRLGVQWDSVKTHPFAINMNPMVNLTEGEKVLMQRETDKIYDQFLRVVAEGRGMSKEQVHEVAQGRVWTGLKAKEIGLVDEIGDLDDAIRIASEMAGLEEYRVKEFPIIEKPWYQDFIKGMNQSAAAKAVLPQDPMSKQLLKEYKATKELMESTGIQARMPYIYDFD